MPPASPHQPRSTSSITRDHEWQFKKAVARKALSSAIDDLKSSFGSAIDSLSDLLAASRQEERPANVQNFETEAKSLVVIPRPIVGRAYRMPAEWNGDGGASRGNGSRVCAARSAGSDGSRKYSDCSSTAAQIPRTRRRAARDLNDEDAESNATLKEFGRRCGMLPWRGQGSIDSEVVVRSDQRHDSTAPTMGRKRIEKAPPLGSEWAMPGLSVFDDESEDDEAYGSAVAVHRVVRKLRREAGVQKEVAAEKQRNASD
ncbi:hypothetical protein Slin15195_G034310 [Septoria linicola]|uniref:Uncharacterized protein n=1 Tax=Septoria linicola TaxID=215465 RepID=A0A9Q9AQA0_9PEZI|nr:hypothetical protein Slin15195_G034310 [Septoria linicola]